MVRKPVIVSSSSSSSIVFGTPFSLDDDVISPNISIDIVQQDGPCELITVLGTQFLRIEDRWKKTVEYVSIDFQVSSIKRALKKLERPVSNGEYAEYSAMLAAEECILHKAEIGKLGNDAAANWERYLKLKELALRPGYAAEGEVALKKALILALETAL